MKAKDSQLADDVDDFDTSINISVDRIRTKIEKIDQRLQRYQDKNDELKREIKYEMKYFFDKI